MSAQSVSIGDAEEEACFACSHWKFLKNAVISESVCSWQPSTGTLLLVRNAWNNVLKLAKMSKWLSLLYLPFL